MARIKLDLDPDTYQRLVERAVDERRPIVWQAEVELQRALGGPPTDRKIAPHQPAEATS